jgi:hypothetical protein
MQQTAQWLPGHLPLAAGKSVGIEPRDCGELQVGAGRIHVGTRAIAPGERIRLWSGDRVELVNPGDRTAQFTWDACASQPSRAQQLRRFGQRIARVLFRRSAPRLVACGDKASCFHP